MANSPVSVVEKAFCTTREAAELLGVSVGTVQLWVEKGLLSAWKTSGGHRRVMRESVTRLLHTDAGTRVAHAAHTRAASRSRQLKILVVDDDPALLYRYALELSRWPMAPQVACIDNASGALLKLGQIRPDLLITELQMPEVDGFSMIRTLRQASEPIATRIVVVTALDADTIQQRGGVPQDIEVLAKPVPFPRLLNMATRIVNQLHFHLPPICHPPAPA